eukprot:GHVR01099461.1.p1 GENE.GHVR01099461.1~~GHVR01099461.1.p1  ORF type:complete len:386 (+),score=68.01 GHVR01099461.1:49-1206(+)
MGAGQSAETEVNGQKPTGRCFNELYKIDNILGKGKNNEVYSLVPLNTGESDHNECVKIISKYKYKYDITILDQYKKWVKIQMSLDHEFLLNINQLYEDNEYFYFTMDRCYGGTLNNFLVELNMTVCKSKEIAEMTVTNIDDRIGKTPVAYKVVERFAACLISQVLLALVYMHKKGITHCSVKPGNILFRDKMCTSLVLSQWGRCCIGTTTTDTANTTNNTTTNVTTFTSGCNTDIYNNDGVYRSPENIKYGTSGPQMDVWGVGIILYFILAGRSPYKSEDDARIGKINWSKDLFCNYCEDTVNFCKKFLVTDPKKRVTASSAIKDYWLQRQLLNAAAMTPLDKPSVPPTAKFLRALTTYIRTYTLYMYSTNKYRNTNSFYLYVCV